MPSTDGRRVRRLGESLGAVLADELEHVEAGLAGVIVGPRADQAVINEGGQPVEDVQPQVGFGRDHAVGRLDCPAAREHGQPSEEGLLGVPEEGATPLDGRAQCPLARWHVDIAAVEEGQCAIEARQQGGRREDLDPRCRQLDRERETVEASADRGDSVGVTLGEAEARPRSLRPVDEQGDGFDACQALDVDGFIRGGNVQRRYRVFLLERDMEGDTTGRDNA